MTDSVQASGSSSSSAAAFDFQAARHQANRDLHILRVCDIKPILGHYRLTKSGSKQELIDRILKLLDERHNAGRTAERDSLIKLLRDEVEKLRNPVKMPIKSLPVTASWAPGGFSGVLGGKQPAGAQATDGAGGAAVGAQGRSPHCICGNTMCYALDKKCITCQKSYHSLCYGQFFPNSKDYCFHCIAARQDPYHTVVETIGGPVKSTYGKQEILLNFRWSAMQASSLISGPFLNGKRSVKVLVRCFPLYPQELNKKPGAKAAKYPPHCWPLESVLRVNNQEIPIKQRKWKGASDPLDIGSYLRSNQNHRVQLTFKDDKNYVLVVSIVKKQTPEQLFQSVSTADSNPTVEAGLARVKSSFKTEGVDDDDDDLMATVTRISLRCPLGMVPIETPARGKACNHLQCFDLSTFLRFNEKNSAASWKCGVCNNPLAIEDIEVDKFLLDIIQKLKDTKSDDIEDIDTIEIDGDGVWKPHSSTAAAASRKRKAEDAAASSSSSKPPAEMVEIQDLSDDDDDNQPLSKSLRQGSFSSVTSGPPLQAPRFGTNHQATAVRGFAPFRAGGGGGGGGASMAFRPQHFSIAALQSLIRMPAASSSSSSASRRGPTIPAARSTGGGGGGGGGASSSGGGGSSSAPVVIDLSLDTDDDDDDDDNDGDNHDEEGMGGHTTDGAFPSGWGNDNHDDDDDDDEEEEDEGPRRRRRWGRGVWGGESTEGSSGDEGSSSGGSSSTATESAEPGPAPVPALVPAASSAPSASAAAAPPPPPPPAAADNIVTAPATTVQAAAVTIASHTMPQPMWGAPSTAMPSSAASSAPSLQPPAPTPPAAPSSSSTTSDGGGGATAGVLNYYAMQPSHQPPMALMGAFTYQQGGANA